MPKMNVTTPHTLSQDAAVERVKGFTDKLNEAFAGHAKDIEQSWDGTNMNFGFRTMGMNIAGVMKVEEDRVDVEADLPFAAAMFKGQIASKIEEQLAKVLR